ILQSVSKVQPSFKDLDSLEDDPVIVVDDSDENGEDVNTTTEDTSVLKSSSPRSSQIQELTIQRAVGKVLKNEFSNIQSAHDFSSSLPTELKDLPSKLNELTGKVKGLKKQVHELEIKLPGDLKEIPTKLDDFTKNVTSLTSQVAELKTLQWDLSTEFLSLPAQVASVQAKLKTLDALPSLLLNVTQALNKFSQVLDSASLKAGDQSVPSAGQADTMQEAKAEAARREEEMRKEELIDLLGPEVVNKYYNDKLHDLHLGEWRKVMKACSNKKGKGWMSIYKQIHERMDYLRTTEAEPGIDLDRPLSEQDPFDRLNNLANKKRKHADGIHDFFRANKRLKLSV
nr:hypothetical protein [Tanacetum cinerariifolium]